jgi:integrase/recombinase XerC
MEASSPPRGRLHEHVATVKIADHHSGIGTGKAESLPRALFHALMSKGPSRDVMRMYISNIGTPHRTLTDREQRQLLKVTSESSGGYRDHVLYAMALTTGLREHELAGLLVGDVFEPDGSVRARVVLRVFKRNTSARAQQEVVVAESLRTKLEKFRIWKAWERENLALDAPLFASNRGTPLSTRQIRHAFSVWQRRAGFDRHVGFHVLRHTACSAVYRLSKDIRLTQRFARHTSVLTTAIYTHPTDEDLLRALEGLTC